MNSLISLENQLQTKFTACFDEAFNYVSYSKQMNLHLIYFNESKQLVTRAYGGSKFMEHPKPEDQLNYFKNGFDKFH